MRYVAIIYKRFRPEAKRLADEISGWLQERGITVFCRENTDAPRSWEACVRSSSSLVIPEETEAVLVLGGDGTLLSVARLLGNRSTPLFGINLGGLGFLTEFSKETCYLELQRIIDGDYEIEERMRLQVSVDRDSEIIFNHVVLNDVVVNKGALARIIQLMTAINGRYLTCYRGDGLIVSSATGSTAYNLSAGGPIVHPTADAIIITPICSFTLTNRPIIVPGSAVITAELDNPIHDVTLTCDGQVGCTLEPSDQITISAAPVPLRLIKTASIDYFQILRTKLKWGLT